MSLVLHRPTVGRPGKGSRSNRTPAVATFLAGLAGVSVAIAPEVTVAVVGLGLLLLTSPRQRTVFLGLVFAPLLVSSTVLQDITGVQSPQTVQKGCVALLVLWLLVTFGPRHPGRHLIGLFGVFALSLVATMARLEQLPVDPGTAMKAFAGYVLPWLVLTVDFRRVPRAHVFGVLSALPLMALAVGLVLELAGIRSLMWTEYTGAQRLTGGLPAAYLASFGMFGSVAAVWLWLRGYRTGLALCGTNLIITLATGTRGASIAAALMIGAAVLMGRPERRPLSRGAKLAIVGVGVAIASWFLPRILERVQGAGSSQGLLSGRGTAWAFFWDQFQRNPWLGNGVGAASIASDESSNSMVRAAFVAPHNTYLQFLVDFGVIGASLAFLLVCLLIRAIRANASGNDRVLVTALSVSMLFYAFFDNLLTSPQPAMAFALTVAALGSGGSLIRAGRGSEPQGKRPDDHSAEPPAANGAHDRSHDELLF